MSERPIPEKIKCQLSGEVCKRGVRVGCCNTIASRSAATKYVTTNRTCWNESCKTEVSTGDLINDENLRAQVERFNKGEEVDETVLSDLIVKAGQEKLEEPPVKKFKQNNVSQNQNKTNQQQSKPRTKRVTLGMMKERNAEFDKYLLPEEKSCQELRVGAQLELMFEFDSSGGAQCLVSGEYLETQDRVLAHLTERLSTEYDHMKSVLSAETSDLGEVVARSLKAEFLYATDKVFPCKVEP